jgi:hypothetical protein
LTTSIVLQAPARRSPPNPPPRPGGILQ